MIWRLMKRMGQAAIVATLAPQAVAQDGGVRLDPVIDSTVRIRTNLSGEMSTGWVIEPADAVNRAGAAVVVTSLNRIRQARTILVREPTVDRDYEATILARDPDRNLVFLEVKDLAAKAVPLASSIPGIGQQVYALGYNAQADRTEGEGRRLAANASVAAGALSRELRGNISTEARAPVNQLEHRAEMLPGFEGGPLIDQCARLIGMNIKSGGEIVPAAKLRISAEATVMDALKVDEVVKVANQYGVKYTVAGGCGAPPAVASTTATPRPVAMNPPQLDAGTTTSGGFAETVTSGPFLGALGVVGLLIAAFGLYTLTRRDEPANATIEPLAPTRTASSRTAEEGPGTALLTDTRPVSTPERSLLLTGRGPAGESIEFAFTSGDLLIKPVTLGVQANADLRIPDNRSDYRVSRLHARISFDGKSFTVEDNKSLNGTFLGGRRIESHVPTPLMNGDILGIADVELIVAIG